MTKTRPIFQAAIERLPEDRSREFSIRFAQIERNLGEIDRARVIYAHCAEICDPRVIYLFSLALKLVIEPFFAYISYILTDKSILLSLQIFWIFLMIPYNVI